MKFIKSHKIATSIIIVVVVLIVAAFYMQLNSVRNEKDLLKKYDLEGLSTEEIVEKLDRDTNYDKGFKASVTSTKLIMSENGVEVEKDIPSDLFYLSFAPYINYTHPCATHFLSSCKSELKNEIFNVTIVGENDEIIISKEMKSMDNGFIGVWLPRDLKGSINVTYNEMSAVANISTFIDDNTCLTEDLKLR